MRILESRQAKEYMKVSHEIGRYVDCSLPIPDDLKQQHESALNLYRAYLMVNCVPELKPRWPYRFADKSTWKYITLNVRNRRFIGEVINPEFRYSEELDND
jgi:hypothetical protein